MTEEDYYCPIWNYSAMRQNCALCVTNGYSSKMLLFYLSKKIPAFNMLMFDNRIFYSNHIALHKSLFIMTKPTCWLDLSGNIVKY